MYAIRSYYVAADDLHIGQELDQDRDAYQPAQGDYERYHFDTPSEAAAPGMASERTSTPNASAKVRRKSAKAVITSYSIHYTKLYESSS